MILLKTFQEEQDAVFNRNFRSPKPFDDGVNAIKADTFLSYIHLCESALLKRIEEEVEKMKMRHICDMELFHDSDCGRMCDNCGQLAYEEGEQCNPNEVNQALDDIKKILI